MILIITLLPRCSYYQSVYQPRALSLTIELGRKACTSCLDFVGIFVHAPPSCFNNHATKKVGRVFPYYFIVSCLFSAHLLLNYVPIVEESSGFVLC